MLSAYEFNVVGSEKYGCGHRPKIEKKLSLMTDERTESSEMRLAGDCESRLMTDHSSLASSLTESFLLGLMWALMTMMDLLINFPKKRKFRCKV